jgi:hypothetical protein
MRAYYGKHHAPELLPHARYVLPELTAPGWKTEAKIIASPGCYPTSILVPLVPLLRDKVVTREHIVVNSFSGVSGAGRKVDEAYLFVERNESAKAYGLVKHRHLAEIEEQLALLTGAGPSSSSTRTWRRCATASRRRSRCPPRPAPRSSRSTPPGRGPTARRRSSRSSRAGRRPDTAHVVGTNRIDMSAVHDPRTGNFIITSAEDNLVKGDRRPGDPDDEPLVRLRRDGGAALGAPGPGPASAPVVGVLAHVLVGEVGPEDDGARAARAARSTSISTQRSWAGKSTGAEKTPSRGGALA